MSVSTAPPAPKDAVIDLSSGGTAADPEELTVGGTTVGRNALFFAGCGHDHYFDNGGNTFAAGMPKLFGFDA